GFIHIILRVLILLSLIYNKLGTCFICRSQKKITDHSSDQSGTQNKCQNKQQTFFYNFKILFQRNRLFHTLNPLSRVSGTGGQVPCPWDRGTGYLSHFPMRRWTARSSTTVKSHSSRPEDMLFHIFRPVSHCL